MLVFVLASASHAGPVPPKVERPRDIVVAAPANAWRSIPPDNLLLLDLADGRRIVIELAQDFTPKHVANLKALVRAKWFDHGHIMRVQDNYVAQWAGPHDAAGLPSGVVANPPPEFDRPVGGLDARFTNWRDGYAAKVGYAEGWPIGGDGASAWLTHCYGTVGVGRGGPTDNGSGVELYAVIGQAPRQIDRNIAIVGRVVEGMPFLATLPRGSGQSGMYQDGDPHIPIQRMAIASDLPAEEQPHFDVMKSGSSAFSAYLHAWALGHYGVIGQPAGGADVCNAAVPIRRHPAS
jgi:peptidylprolyl isomerase